MLIQKIQAVARNTSEARPQGSPHRFHYCRSGACTTQDALVLFGAIGFGTFIRHCATLHAESEHAIFKSFEGGVQRSVSSGKSGISRAAAQQLVKLKILDAAASILN